MPSLGVRFVWTVETPFRNLPAERAGWLSPLRRRMRASDCTSYRETGDGNSHRRGGRNPVIGVRFVKTKPDSKRPASPMPAGVAVHSQPVCIQHFEFVHSRLGWRRNFVSQNRLGGAPSWQASFENSTRDVARAASLLSRDPSRLFLVRVKPWIVAHIFICNMRSPLMTAPFFRPGAISEGAELPGIDWLR